MADSPSEKVFVWV